MALVTALTLLSAGPAAAHNQLISVDPPDGASVARTPATIVLTFNEPALPLGTQVVVTGPEGPVSQGAVQCVDNTVRQNVVADAPAGTYTVEWRVTSGDGHPLTGRLTFTAEAVGGGTAGPDADSPATVATSPVVPAWAWWLGLVIVLAAATVALVALRRRAASSPGG